MGLDALEGMARLRQSEIKGIVVRWLEHRLTEAKDRLAEANDTNFRKYQGRIEELKEQIKFVNGS